MAKRRKPLEVIRPLEIVDDRGVAQVSLSIDELNIIISILDNKLRILKIPRYDLEDLLKKLIVEKSGLIRKEYSNE